MQVPDKVNEIKGVVALVLATLTALWGWLGWAVLIWVVCVVLDYASGTAAAKKAGEWSSAIARDGLWHKMGEVFAVLVAALCDIALSVIMQGSGVPIGIDLGPVITPIVLLWYIITELGSIIENAGALGAPIPAWLQRSLKDYKRKLDADQGVAEVVGEPVYIGKHDRESESKNENTHPDNKNAHPDDEKQTE